ncbi:MAG: hypothetical protein ACRYFX_27250 [Janthinobacterium lividum]
MANHATLGHFLPYLLGRRLRAVVWPDSTSERLASVGLLTLLALYGVGFGLLLRHVDTSDELAAMLPKLLVGMNATWLVSALLVDFMPSLRPVVRPLAEHFPVSARQNVVTAFLLDLVTLRRLLLGALLGVAMLVAPSHALVPGFSLLLVLGAAVLSFNMRFLAVLGRWRHPFLLLHLASLGLMLWWLAHPSAPYYTSLGVGMALLPWLLWAAQLYWLAPYFSARYQPAEAATAQAGELTARLPLGWKVYVRKAWPPLVMGLVFKVFLMGITAYIVRQGGNAKVSSIFYLALQPVIGFTYANNNLFGFLAPLAANELQRLGLTSRLLGLYLRIVGPVVLVDCLLSAALLLGLFPGSYWHLLGLLPLAAIALTAIGLWGSLYQAKPVLKSIDFANMRNNASGWMSVASLTLAGTLYFLPWWWARIALAALVAASAYWPIWQVQRNDGELRRRLWKGIGA